jgi:Na+-driven multidrug efflux pump
MVFVFLRQRLIVQSNTVTNLLNIALDLILIFKH